MVVAFVVVIASGGVYYYFLSRAPSADEQIFCTQEAKQCPDGSYVSRTGPQCEFAQCPSQPAATSASQIPDDWKTYRNEKYGFEFRYPYKIFNGNGTAYLIQTHKDDLCGLRDGGFAGGDLISSVPFKGKMGYAGIIVCILQEKNSIKDLRKRFDSLESKIITTDNVQALKTIDFGMAESEDTWIPVNDVTIHISSTFGLIDSNIFDKVISTFKFIK